MKNNKWLKIFVPIAAFLIAANSAFFSIYGLSKLFAGAELSVIIMASTLEFGKLIAVSYLYRYRKRIKPALKGYLTAGTVILMLITSIGVYGFLSSAYQVSATQMEKVDNQISLLNNKKTIYLDKKTQISTINNDKTKRIELLNGIRHQQEIRLDNAIYNSDKKRIDIQIANADKQINRLQLEIDSTNRYTQIYTDSINKFDIEIVELKNNEKQAGEIGPLKYLSSLTGMTMNKIINILILLLIFVFDPLAISLVIAANQMSEMDNEEEIELEDLRKQQEMESIRKEREKIHATTSDFEEKKKKLLNKIVPQESFKETKIKPQNNTVAEPKKEDNIIVPEIIEPTTEVIATPEQPILKTGDNLVEKLLDRNDNETILSGLDTGHTNKGGIKS